MKENPKPVNIHIGQLFKRTQFQTAFGEDIFKIVRITPEADNVFIERVTTQPSSFWGNQFSSRYERFLDRWTPVASPAEVFMDMLNDKKTEPT